MKIICVVKFVPDVDNFVYDYEKNVLVREKTRMILNPDDACALAFALKVKAGRPSWVIEVVTMAPRSAVPHMEDLLRLSTDRGTVLSDPAFAGSDTYATSRILGRYLSSQSFDCLLTGTHALDGDTSHVPAQLGELLRLNQMSGIVRIDESRFDSKKAVFDVENETSLRTYEMALPAILSLDRESGYKLPYAKYEDLNRDVSDRLHFMSRGELGFEAHEVGLKGSRTRVIKTYGKTFDKREKKIVTPDDEGIEEVFSFIKEKGYL